MDMKRADVAKMHGRMEGRCLWCGRERWTPDTTPGWNDKSVPRKHGDPSHVKLTWRGDGLFTDAVSRVHWECWADMGHINQGLVLTGKEVKRPSTAEQRLLAKKSKKPSRRATVDADLSQVLSLPEGRACIRCNGYGAFNKHKAEWYRPENVGDAKGTAYRISWPEFGHLGAHSDYVHAECWMSWPQSTRNRKSRKEVIDFDSAPGELKLT